MSLNQSDFLFEVWAFDDAGNKKYPYKGERGEKKGLFSVNFSSDTNNFQGMTEEELVQAITSGKFRKRGTIRMLSIDPKPGDLRSAYRPEYYKGRLIADF